jgi:hypothetical protein
MQQQETLEYSSFGLQIEMSVEWETIEQYKDNTAVMKTIKKLSHYTP